MKKNKIIKSLLMTILATTMLSSIPLSQPLFNQITVQAASNDNSNNIKITHVTVHKQKNHLVSIVQDASLSADLSFNHITQVHQGDLYHSNKTVTVKFDHFQTLHLTYLKGFGYVNSLFVKSSDINSTPTLAISFDENLVTTPQEVTNKPWEKFSDGHDVIEPLVNGRTIYYRIDSTGKLHDYWQKAIDNWNSLGVVQFVPTTDTDNQRVLTLSDADSIPQETANWQGITISNQNRSDNNSLVYNLCYLRDRYMNSTTESDYQKVCVAEHELGHVLGFDHDVRNYNVPGDKNLIKALMNPATEDDKNDADYLQLNEGAKEQHVLMLKYNLSVLPGYLTYPDLNLPTVNNDNNNVQLASNVPGLNEPYNYQTNHFANWATLT